MSFEALKRLDKARTRGLAHYVLFWLAWHHNGQNGKCYPSLSTLARESGLNRSTISRALKALVASGDIKIEHGWWRAGTANSYTLLYMSPRMQRTPTVGAQSIRE